MPICLNCEIELPQGTIDCPHCGEECEQEVESNDGGILAGAWDNDDDFVFSDEEPAAEPAAEPVEEPLSFEEPEPVAEELPQVEPVPDEEPVFADLGGGGDDGGGEEELPLVEAAPAPADAAEDEAARKKAERAKRKLEREAKRAAEAEAGGGDDDADTGKVKRRSTTERKKKGGTSKREKSAGGKTSKRAKKGGAEARPAKPKKDPTLSQHRKAVVTALFSWFIFVALYGAAFAQGLIWPSPNEGASQANMANVMFAGLGLFAMLFLWAQLKMGRYISITTVVIALGVEGWFFIRGLENLPAFVGVGLFMLAQLLLLTGSGWLIRSFFGFIFTVVGGALFAVPHVVDYVMMAPEAQVVRVRRLMAGEIGLNGESTEDGATRAETHEVWPEMIMVADKFDEAEQTLTDLTATAGVSFLDGLITKPALRERIMIETVITHLWMVNAGYSPGEGKSPDPLKGVDKLYDALDMEAADKVDVAAWRAIRDQSIDRMMLYVRRFMEASPTGGGSVGAETEWFSAEIKLAPLAGWNEAKTWPMVVQKNDSRFVVVDDAWREKTETKGVTSAKRVWLQNDWWDLSAEIATLLEWDVNELRHVVATARKLAAMDAEIIVTEAEAPAGAEPAAGDGEGEGEGEGDKGDGEGEGGDEEDSGDGEGDGEGDGGGDDGGDDGGEDGEDGEDG